MFNQFLMIYLVLLKWDDNRIMISVRVLPAIVALLSSCYCANSVTRWHHCLCQDIWFNFCMEEVALSRHLYVSRINNLLLAYIAMFPYTFTCSNSTQLQARDFWSHVLIWFVSKFCFSTLNINTNCKQAILNLTQSRNRAALWYSG